jgi:hypothetical protein
LRKFGYWAQERLADELPWDYMPGETVNITGRVVDDSTGAPLHFVNVFLSNTTMGAATDAAGNFSITNIPYGNYELVASMVGYEIRVFQVRLIEPKTQSIDIRLKSKPIEAPGLAVTAPYPHEWKRQLERFKKLFLGTSRYASQCDILNPEFLEFDIDEKTGIFIAEAGEPLEIENQALGYRIRAHLLDFRFRSDHDGRYTCIALFEPLESKDERVKRMWAKNRLQAYQGSKRHFFKVLYHKRIKEEELEVYNIPKFHIHDRFLHLCEVVEDSLLNPGEFAFTKKLCFSDYIMVKKHRTSWISMKTDRPVTIDVNGNVYPPYGIKTYGHWTRMRLADELPVDYSPESEHTSQIVE